jgi:hypothetical protein
MVSASWPRASYRLRPENESKVTGGERGHVWMTWQTGNSLSTEATWPARWDSTVERNPLFKLLYSQLQNQSPCIKMYSRNSLNAPVLSHKGALISLGLERSTLD